MIRPSVALGRIFLTAPLPDSFNLVFNDRFSIGCF